MVAGRSEHPATLISRRRSLSVEILHSSNLSNVIHKQPLLLESEGTRSREHSRCARTLRFLQQYKITGDNIYKVLICFEELYNVMNPLERKKLMEHLISEIQIYPERQPNGQWLKSIKFRLPIVEKDIDLCLDNESHTECITALTRMKP